jgi:hypothetical protein
MTEMIANPASISTINNQQSKINNRHSSFVIPQSSIHPPLPLHSLATFLPAIARRTAAGATLRFRSLFFLITAAFPMAGPVRAI